MKLIQIAIITIYLFGLSSCATLKSTEYFEPQMSEKGWTQISNKKGFLVFGGTPSDVGYNCGESKFIFKSVALLPFGFIGPPFIPFPFPFTLLGNYSDRINVELEYVSPENKTKIIKSLIVYKDIKREPLVITKVETKGDSSSLERYIFAETWKDADIFILEIVTNDPGCGAISVHYNKNNHTTYSMF